MTDACQYPGSDLTLSATGDLLIAGGLDESQQRVLRRLVTNPTQYDTAGNVIAPGDYLWEPNYGAGLPAWVGRPLDEPTLSALIKSQMYLEASVVQNPEPQVGLQSIPNGVSTQIAYTEAESGEAAYLNFDVTP